jgi:hypothetical protein
MTPRFLPVSFKSWIASERSLRFKYSATVAPQSFQAPILIERAGPSTRKKFFEFFTVPIRNAHTRAAYYRAIQQFLAWVERAGYQHLEDIEPITVAAYIETLQRQAAPAEILSNVVYRGGGASLVEMIN